MNPYRIRQVGSVYIADSAVIVGDVQLGDECSVWHHCTIRGDVAPVRVGARVNIQDGSILHCKANVPLEIADDVSIGHSAVVHCSRVGPHSLIATRATILDDCRIGAECIIAAGAVVTPGTQVPDGSMVMGVPGRVVRPLRDAEREYLRYVVKTYLRLAARHAAGEFVPPITLGASPELSPG